MHSQTSKSKLWPCLFFLTAHNFANGPHFVALTQLRATKTGSKICCTHLSYTFSESWVRQDSVGTCPEKIYYWKFWGMERLTKCSVFHWSLLPPPKKLRFLLPGVLLSSLCLSYKKLQLRKLSLYRIQFPASMYHSGKALKECLQARLPVRCAQFQMWIVNTSRIIRGGRRLVTQLGLCVSQVYRSRWIHFRRYITREHGSLPIWPMALPDWVPLECVLARQTHRVSERLRSQVRLWSPLPIILHCTSARDI